MSKGLEAYTRGLGFQIFPNLVYIDTIGVPQGVPDKFKAKNQIAAGFESILFW
jgi:hypothetical protein